MTPKFSLWELNILKTIYYTKKIICIYIHLSMIYQKKGIYENFEICFLEYMSFKFRCQKLERFGTVLRTRLEFSEYLVTDLKHLVFPIRFCPCFVKILTAMVANKTDKFYKLLQSLPLKNTWRLISSSLETHYPKLWQRKHQKHLGESRNTHRTCYFKRLSLPEIS